MTDTITYDLSDTNVPVEAGPRDPEDPRFTPVVPDDAVDEDYFYEPSPDAVPPRAVPDGEGMDDLAIEGEPPVFDRPTERPSDGDPSGATMAPSPGAAGGGAFVRMSLPAYQICIWAHAVQNLDRLASIDVERHAEQIRSAGQLRVPQARITTDGTFELVNGVLDKRAFDLLSSRGDERQMLIDVAPLSMEEAFRYALLEGRADTKILAYDRACTIQAAITVLGCSQKQVAGLLAIDEATVTNSLHILDVEQRLGSVIADPWSITENQAKRFQKIWADPVRRREVRLMIAALEPGTARKHMSAIFAAHPTTRKNELPILDAAGNAIGSIRPSGVRVSITLEAAANAVVADDVALHIAVALGSLRSKAV